MGMFSDLMNKIFHHGAAEHPKDAAPSSGAMPSAQESRNAEAAATHGGPAPVHVVDVEATLDRLAAANPQKLDWKHSIVDLMKLLGMDSSLAERKELAADLHYTGDTHDSATMNIWLHKVVMQKLAENGGKVPAELLNR
ncbi:MAG: DUF3597 domain-containing protein [Thermoanaerobaculia bacterium]